MCCGEARFRHCSVCRFASLGGHFLQLTHTEPEPENERDSQTDKQQQQPSSLLDC